MENPFKYLPSTPQGKQLTERNMLKPLLEQYTDASGKLTNEGVEVEKALRAVVEGGQSLESQPILKDLNRGGGFNEWLGRTVGGGRGELKNEELLDAFTELSVGSLDPKILAAANRNKLLYKDVVVGDRVVSVRRSADDIAERQALLDVKNKLLIDAGILKEEVGIKDNYGLVSGEKPQDIISFSRAVQKVKDQKQLTNDALKYLPAEQAKALVQGVKSGTVPRLEAEKQIKEAKYNANAEATGQQTTGELEQARQIAKQLDLYKLGEGERELKLQMALADAKHAADLKSTAMQNDANMERYRAELEYDRQKDDEDRRIKLATMGYGAAADLLSSIFMYV